MPAPSAKSERLLKEYIQAEAAMVRWKKVEKQFLSKEWADWTENERLEFTSIVREMRPWLEEAGIYDGLTQYLREKGMSP